jgi:hypothetical protein
MKSKLLKRIKTIWQSAFEIRSVGQKASKGLVTDDLIRNNPQLWLWANMEIDSKQEV